MRRPAPPASTVEAPEPDLGAALSRGRGEGAQGSRRLEGRARGAQPEARSSARTTLAAAWAAFLKTNPPDDKDAFPKGWMAARKDGADQGRHGPDLRIAAGPALGPRSATHPGEPCVCHLPDRAASGARAGRRRRAGAARVEFADPHAALAAPVEAEVTRVRKLTGVWRWLLIVATAATIFLCINQQFTLRFFVGFTQLNTEYFYLLIAVHAALHVPDLPGQHERAARPRALVRRRCCSSPRSPRPST